MHAISSLNFFSLAFARVVAPSVYSRAASTRVSHVSSVFTASSRNASIAVVTASTASIVIVVVFASSFRRTSSPFVPMNERASSRSLVDSSRSLVDSSRLVSTRLDSECPIFSLYFVVSPACTIRIGGIRILSPQCIRGIRVTRRRRPLVENTQVTPYMEKMMTARSIVRADRSCRSIVSIDRVDRSGVSLARSVRDVSRVDATMDDAFARVDAVVADRAPPSVERERGGAHGAKRGATRGARVDRGRRRGRRRRAREERLREIRKSGGGDVRASWDRERCRGGGEWKRETRWVGRSEDAREEGFRGARGGGETEVDARVTIRVLWENDAE